MARRRRIEREKQLRLCQQCQRSFEGRSNAEYCSERCRKAAFRTRERQGAQDRDRRLQSLVEALAREVGLRVEDLE